MASLLIFEIGMRVTMLFLKVTQFLGIVIQIYFYCFQIDFFENYDWQKIQTPINVEALEQLLKESGYDRGKTRYLTEGFKRGFSIGHHGESERTDMAENLPLNNLGTKVDLWNKVMKEVGLSRYAGPYHLDELPVRESFIQSLIGLVPKAGNQMRLIFHLSYDFKNGNKSVNACTPDDICHVKYKDLDYAIDVCIKILKKQGRNHPLFFFKSDIKSAFCLIPVLISHRRWLVLKADDPRMGETCYFIDLCLPFGTSISCAVFQSFSDALAHLTEYLFRAEEIITNYLDDFLFVAISKQICDEMTMTFVRLCERLNCPLSEEKTEWASVVIVFWECS